MTAMRSLRTMAACLLALFTLQACGNASFDTTQVTGVVEAPAGMIARNDAATPGLLARIRSDFSGVAWAITGLQPVGAGVAVGLERIDAHGNVTQQLTTVKTASDGSYGVALVSGENPGPFLTVSVGSDATLMRAFVSGSNVSIDSATEATVRLLLSANCNLANVSAPELQTIQTEVDRATLDVAAGSTIAETNGKAEQRATDDVGVQAAITAACQG